MRRARILPYMPAVVAVLAFGSAPHAQTGGSGVPAALRGPVSVVADSVSIDRNAGTLTARGNVEVEQEGRVLRAREIVYAQNEETIRAEGPLVLVDPETGVVQAEYAELTSDLAEGLIQSAQLLLAGELQIAAAQVRRVGGRYTTLHHTIASSCEVCIGDRAPTWAIRAERIVRDDETLAIHLRNATLEVFGQPIAWVPYFRISDPSVRRASGVLTPDFHLSDIYGFGVRVPYYHVLGPSADATITPFITQRGGTLLEGEYRQRFARGALDVSGVVTLDDGLEDRGARGSFAASGFYDLGKGFRAELDAEAASDDRFLRQFDYSEADRLTSTARIVRTRANDTFYLGGVAFQSLRPEEDNAQVPLILPELRYRRLWQDGVLGGRLGANANVLGLVRDGGRDVLRFGGGGDWRRDTTVGPGVVAAGSLGLEADAYFVQNDPGAADRTEQRIGPWARAELRWPLSRETRGAIHIIEPVVDIAWSETFGGDAIPNEDSQLPEFDETNLFALDRYPGRDRSESGLRANIGFSYTVLGANGRSAQATLGRVVRFTDTDQFEDGTGLGGRTSDWVGALEVDLGPGLSAINRFRVQDDFDVRRNEFGVTYDAERTGVAASWIYLADGAVEAGTLPETSEFSVSARHRFLPNWQIRGNWRYDTVSDTTLRAGAGLTYGNECAEIDLSISRRYVTAGDVPPSTSIGFAVRLVGLGATGTQAWPRRSCSG